jgi:hypothetical protein
MATLADDATAPPVAPVAAAPPNKVGCRPGGHLLHCRQQPVVQGDGDAQSVHVYQKGVAAYL